MLEAQEEIVKEDGGNESPHFGAFALVKYDAARKALVEARRVDEVKGIRDKAVALQAYARQASDTEMQNWAAEIRLRAERRAGELLEEMAEHGQRAKQGDGAPTEGRGARPSKQTPTLEELGVTKDQSSKWQKLAHIDEKQFEDALNNVKSRGDELTTNILLKELRPPTFHKNDYVKADASISDITATFTELRSKLSDLNLYAKQISRTVLTSETQTDIETLIRTLRELSKDLSGRADRLEQLLQNNEVAA